MRTIAWNRSWRCLATGILILTAAEMLSAAEATPPQGAAAMEKDFLQPPAAARPWVYWFWLNGNITREGITADLEAMKRVGVGGVLIMEVDLGAPKGPADFAGPLWRELFQHVCKEADRLGLEINMNNDAGWCGSGGPWITPELSMQRVVWTETIVQGPKSFHGALARPQAVRNFYQDIAVLAMPAPEGKARIEDFQGKSFVVLPQHWSPPRAKFASLSAESVIPRDRIVDLTGKMDAGGKLAWDVPAGKWLVLRFGHASTDVCNHPAPAAGCGLECDKLSKAAAEAQFNGLMGRLIAENRSLSGKGKALVATHIDSWEVGTQNWTPRMREEFQERRGYDLLPLLPTFTGRVVDSLEVSERFLWDLRQTVSDMLIENYAGHFRALANRHGLRLSLEAYDGVPCDRMTYAGHADEPMSEFWSWDKFGTAYSCTEMASAAHVYGKRIVGAEAFTASEGEKWLGHPAYIKDLGDWAFCEGVNRFVFHRYAMQPWTNPNRAPGMSMGPYGLHYERTQTWWEQSRAWHEYLARCQCLLRQGLFVADVCYLQPEGAPRSFAPPPTAMIATLVRGGYNFDGCTPEVVLKRMSVKDGRIVLPDGMSYRVLVLPPAETMTPTLLGKIKELVEAGATVLGPRPLASPSLSDYPQCDQSVRQLAEAIWGDCDGAAAFQEHRLGHGRVVWGPTAEKLLAGSGVLPDFTATARLRYIHRRAGGTDLYFVSNPASQSVLATATFRTSGSQPEFWWPDSGRIEPAPMFQSRGGMTQVLLPLEASGSVFVVFGRNAVGDAAVALSRDGQSVCAISGPAVQIVVKKAVYGVPGDPARTCDVLAKVQKKADQGECKIAVAEMGVGKDPAPKVLKTLAVEYVINNRQFSVHATDGQTITLGCEAVKATIDKALYGVLDDPKRTRDVRAKLQQWIDAGENGFQVGRLAEGDDPAVGTQKTVVIEYTLRGRRLRATGADQYPIFLGAVEPSPLVADLGRDADGGLQLVAWKPGRYYVGLASGRTQSTSVPPMPAAPEVARPWEVTFPPSAGTAKPLAFDRLVSWTERPEPGVKYFSGTAIYRAGFQVSPELLAAGRRLCLDLGDVQTFAEVKLNDKDLGVLWKPPFRLDVANSLVAGENHIEVRVTNLWPNRMIGDELLPEDSERWPNGTLKKWPDWLQQGKPSPTGRQTFTSWRLWKKGDSLLPSGLLGPVRFVPGVAVPVRGS